MVSLRDIFQSFAEGEYLTSSLFTITYYLLPALILLSQSAKEQIFRRLRRQNVCLIVLWIIRIPNPNK